MAKVNRIEAEVDAIRDKIYEETKDMTREERAKRLKNKVQRLSKQYNFRIVGSANG